jgi:hypothetical protein
MIDRRTPRLSTLLRWLLLGDALLIAADVLQRNMLLHDVRSLVTHDRGYGEIFQYGKAAFGCVLLLWIAARRASLSALLWAVLLAVVLLDDSLEIHERAGGLLAPVLGLASFGSLRADRVGDVVFYGGLGMFCLAAIGLGWWRGDKDDRRLSRTLLVWFAALGFCAVILDAVSSLLRKSSWGPWFAALEDGGEMVVLSFLVVAVWTAFQQYRRQPSGRLRLPRQS